MRQLAESCEFENLCESLICDRLIIGTPVTAYFENTLSQG